jgi:hypothetical protein
MATLEQGVCSPKVKALQVSLNKALGPGTVKESGTYDEATMMAVAKLQKKLGITQTGKADDGTLNSLKDALVKRTQVTVNGKTAWVTEQQLKALQGKANGAAANAVDGYVKMANEAQIIWKAHHDAREGNWFMSRVVDTATGATFPSKTVISNAMSAANSMKSAAAAGTLTKKDLGAKSAPIREAFAAIEQYRSETFGGGEELIRNLQAIQDTCVVVLEISAAVATGGATWQIQVGVAAGIGAYKAVLAEIDKAPTDHKQTLGSAGLGVLKGAAVDGAVALVMKGRGKGVEKFADDVAKKAIAKVGNSTTKARLQGYAIKAVNGGGKKLVEDGLKGIPNLSDPKAKHKPADLVEAAARSFATGAGLEILGPALDKYGAKASKHFKPGDFKGLGNVNYTKAMAGGGATAIDKAGNAAVTKLLSKLNGKKPSGNVERELRMCVLKDPGVNAWIKKAAKNKKFKK